MTRLALALVFFVEYKRLLHEPSHGAECAILNDEIPSATSKPKKSQVRLVQFALFWRLIWKILYHALAHEKRALFQSTYSSPH